MSRRSQAACDACRVRKIRCDSDDRPVGQPCSRCLISELECKFTYKRKKRKPNVALRQNSKLPDSAPALIEEILSSPDSYVPPSDPATVRDVILSLARYARSIQSTMSRSVTVEGDSTLGGISSSSSPQQDSSPPTEVSSSEDESSDGDGNSETFNHLSSGHSKARHFGKSSNFRFMHSALGLSKENQSLNLELDLARFRRPQYWGTEMWNLQPDPSPIYSFPETDLLWVLIRDYFHYMGPYTPILHRQTFENGVIHGWHRIDQNFGAIVLAVCAIAARFTDDPRVLLQDSKLAAGWQYFRQIHLVRSNFVEPASIFELQMYCLAYVYLHHTNMSDSTWTLVGLALRLALDRGMHRLKAENGRTAESELCIRVFWLLRGFDIVQGMTLGRIAAVSSDDFDLDEPVECDDEFWEKTESTEAFIQPVGKISTLCFFTRYNKLMEIAGSVQRIIYGIKPPGSSSSQTSPVERIRQKVMEHDSALNEWLASLPNHLRWDPHQPNETWLVQAVILHVTFYWVQMQIHKSFMIRPSTGNSESQQTYPSLAIVANAAKSSVHIAQVLLQRSPKHLPQIALHIAQSNTVLMLIIWRHKRGIAPLSDIKTVASDVKSAFELLRAADTSSQTVGRVADKLMAFITAEGLLSDIPAPPILTTKRSREPDVLVEPYLGEAFSQPEYRPIVGSQRVSSYMANVSRTSVDFSEASGSFETSNFMPPASTSWIYQGENPVGEHEDYMPMSGTSPILKDRFQTSTDHFVNNQSSVQPAHPDSLAEDERSNNDWDTFMRNVDEVLFSAGLN